MFIADLKTQGRVVGALVMRELQGRYGRDNLGFLWLIGEPLMFAWGVIALWHIMNGSYYHKLPIIPVVTFGYLPLLLYRHMVGNSLHHVRGNASLLFHARVTIIDLYLSRVVMETAGNILAFACTYLMLYTFGQMDWPANPGELVAGYFFMVWYSAATMAFMMPLSERSELVEKFWTPISYLYLPLSGAYLMVQWFPDQWRSWYLLIPSVSAYEMIRGGYFGDEVTTFTNLPYLALFCGISTLVGLWLFRTTRDYIVF